ncbi:MAG TPA: amidohydrolase family protein [Chloroflexota bacterium]
MLELVGLEVVDNHVHPWRASTSTVTADELAGHVAFSETVVTSVRRQFLPQDELAPSLRLFRETNLGCRYFLRELAGFLDVEPDWPTVTAARNAQAAADYHAWTAHLFSDVGLQTLLVDEGGAQPRITLSELASHVPGRLLRVARADNFIRDLLLEEDSWPRFFERYQQALEDALSDGAIAFKSVIAYRTGLDVSQPTESEAAAAFDRTRLEVEGAQKTLRDFLLCHTMDVARERNVWMHIHAGVGDPDIVFEHANPAQLYPLLHSERFRRNRVVLVHGGWPWLAEAAAMVSILPNVYLDLSEGALFGMANVRHRLQEALEACPYTKILYGADGSLPEALWIAARRFKAILARLLDDLVEEGFCVDGDVLQIAESILSGNARRLYRL